MTTIAVCLKWVAHPGEPNDERFAGMSAADQSALEFALQQGAAMGAQVVAVTVGPPGAEGVLRDALACGATRAIRVDAPRGASSATVAEALTGALDAIGERPGWVWCGDYSLDRGSGSVPAYLAARLDAAQALGIIAVTPDGHGRVSCTRRLDGGRRELLSVTAPAVVSVEGGTTTLRRAALPAVRRALTAVIDVRSWSGSGLDSAHHGDAVVMAYRPRAKALDAPAGERTLDRLHGLIDLGATTAAAAGRGEQLTLEPHAAAERIVRALGDWGYLDPA